MFSATKFVVAGVIVALFGGFLLSGVLTQPSEEALPAVGASASASASDEASSLVWERMEMPAGLADEQWIDLRSTGTYFVARSDQAPVFVSRDGLDWSELPLEGEIIAMYEETLVVVDDDRLTTVRMDGSPSASDDRLLELDQAELPRGALLGGAPADIAYGPAGLVSVGCDGFCAWHTADGQTWEEIQKPDGDGWSGILATDAGFYIAPWWSRDGHEWVQPGRSELVGAWDAAWPTPFGMVVASSLALAVTTPDGLEQLALPVDMRDTRTEGPYTWGAGDVGVVIVIHGDRSIARSTDGITWHTQSLPGSMPSLLEHRHSGYHRHSSPLIAGGAVLLETLVCPKPDGTEMDCGESVDPDTHVKQVWFRGTPSASAPAPELPTTKEPATATSTTPDLLPGVELVTEQVEPGTFRVLSDGVRDLSRDVRDVAVSADGDVWLELGTSRNWSVVLLGEPGVSRTLGRGVPWWLGLTSDAVPVVKSGGGTKVLDGEAWVKAELTAFDDCVVSVGPHTVAGADGGCWSWTGPPDGTEVLVRLEPNGVRTVFTRAEMGLEPDHSVSRPVVAPDGTVWYGFGGPRSGQQGTFDGLVAYDGSAWSVIPYDGDDLLDGDSGTGVDADGVVWTSRCVTGGPAILSWDGESWTSHQLDVSRGPCALPVQPWPNGIVWFGSDVRWDGSTLEAVTSAVPWGSYGLVNNGPVASALDGSAWTVIEQQLYVITPEAVAGTE